MEAPTPVAEEPQSLDQVEDSGNLAGARWLHRLASPLAGATCWWCDLQQALPVVASLRALLSPAEHARAARFGTETLALRWIAGRASLRLVLGHVLGVRPAAADIVRGTRGRPALAREPGFDFNVSHTGHAALIAVASGARIGVDLERSDRSLGADRLAAKFLTAAERATLTELLPDQRRVRFLRHWTCKEAMSKATGDGLSAPLRRISVAVDEATGLRLLGGPDPYGAGQWGLHAIAVPGSYFGTLAHWRAWPGNPA